MTRLVKIAVTLRHICCGGVCDDTGEDSCDVASHLLWLSLCDETGKDSCDVASRVPFAGYTS